MKSDSRNGVPITWRSIYERDKLPTVTSVQEDINYAREFVELDDNQLVDAYSGMEFTVASGLALLDVSRSSELVALCASQISRACETVKKQQLYKWGMGSSVLQMVLIVKGSGFAEELQIDAEWLKGILCSGEILSDLDRRKFALIALAVGDPECAMQFIGSNLIVEPWRPNQTFEFNIFELIRYLATALVNQVGVEDIQPAFNEFIELFPIHLAASASSLPDLFNLAYVVARIEGNGFSRVNSALNEQIKELIKCDASF